MEEKNAAKQGFIVYGTVLGRKLYRIYKKEKFVVK